MRLVSLLMVAALALLGCTTGALPPSAPNARLNKPLPSFTRPALDGSVVSTEQLGGQVVVVKFFAKYCKPCRKTLPAAEQLHRRNRDVRFIGVALDETSAEAAEMAQRYALSFPVLHDRGLVLADTFGVSKIPATFVTDRGGVIRWVGGEQQTEDDLEAALAWVKQKTQQQGTAKQQGTRGQQQQGAAQTR